MTPIVPSCMGGNCSRREKCGHFHAACESHLPEERLCPPGQDGASQRESADMTRIHFSTAARVEQVSAVLAPKGITTIQIANALGVKSASRMSLILKAAVDAGVAFGTFARVSEDKQTPEMVYFPTAADRDTFRAVYEVEIVKRRKERQSRKARSKYLRNRSKEIAKRSAMRKEARELREANAIAEAIARRARQQEQAAAQEQARVLRRAEAEQRKERARLDREAQAAAKQREKAEAATKRKRLQAETRQAGLMAKVKAAKPAPVVIKPRGPAFIEGPADESNAKKFKADTPPDRFAVEKAPSVISSSQCRPWAEAVAA